MANISKAVKSAESSIRPYRKVDASARGKFLRALKRSGNITYSAQYAGIRPRAVYAYAQKNKRFNARMQEAREAFTSTLEAEAVRRGRDGYFEPVYQNGELVGYRQRYSDRLLETMLRANDPEKFGKQTIEHKGDINAPIALAAVPAKSTPIDIDAMRTANSKDNPALTLYGDE